MKPALQLFAVALAVLPLSALHSAEDVLLADFEGANYGDWKVTGEAFGPGPARGTLPGQMTVDGFLGKGLVNSYHGGDNSIGSLTSPPFRIERPSINFLIGGGMHPGEACINLLAEGRTIRTATGPNDRPGGRERLDWHSWDVKELMGRMAVLQIVDHATGGWGHINIDHIVQSDRARAAAGPATRQFPVEKRYLHLPVKNKAPKVRMKVAAGETIVDEFDLELAPGEPDFWVFLDLDRFRGQTVTASVPRLPDESQGLANLRQSDQVPGAETLYQETGRPQFHFSSRRGWNNDPNGLVFHRGEYHLYYQHNPYGWNWGNMHWGHAVSTNLVEWTELPIAIYPSHYGDWAFSGSAILDPDNTSGFKTGDEDVLIAAYTSTGRGEVITCSNDRGRTFTEFAGNPVVKHSGRDPKIIWYAPGRHWVMAVYTERDKVRSLAFYTSPDLKVWTYQSRLDGYYECPELFELPVEGDPHETRWVVHAADGDYALGAFDGKTFTPEHTGKHRFNFGNCFYASQTFNNIPAADGRRIQIAWGRVGHPAMPFNQMMNFPVELTLHRTGEGLRLSAWPVREIATLWERQHEFKNLTLPPGENPWAKVPGELLDLELECVPGKATAVGLNVRGVAVTYDTGKQELSCRDKTVALKLEEGKFRLRLLVDRTSIEIFGNRGRLYMPMGVILDPDNRSVEVVAKDAPATVSSLVVRELRSAWPAPTAAKSSRP